MNKGIFVVFEGIDASGKETQAKLMTKHLGAFAFSFPNYNSPTGKLIKGHLKKEWYTRVAYGEYGRFLAKKQLIDPLVFQSLMTVNRMEVAQHIKDLLAAGENVVADRYYASGLVYGSSDGLDLDYLWKIHRVLPQPDITFLLDISAEESFRRRPDRGGDRYEESRAKMEDVANRYRDLFAENSRRTYNRWVVLDGTQSPEKIHQDAVAILSTIQ